ncbi:MAG TPA: CcmD family protein [Terriglobia bacterium]|jgi:CcmD family protein|nr:CcmD family protein [Terriglobia bacterium]
MSFLFAAYSVIWVLLFAYIVSIARRQKRIQDDLAQVQQWLDRTQRK